MDTINVIDTVGAVDVSKVLFPMRCLICIIVPRWRGIQGVDVPLPPPEGEIVYLYFLVIIEMNYLK